LSRNPCRHTANVALAIALCAALAPAGCGVVRSKASAPGSRPVSAADATASAQGTSQQTAPPIASSTVTSESAPPYSAVTTQPDLPAPALDAFIAQQYPGYKVRRRISLPGQIDPGRLSVAYLLTNVREPRFTLLVNVAQLSPAETPADAETSHYLDLVGRVLTNDDAFSLDAARRYAPLSAGGQDAIVSAFVARKPSADAIAHDGAFDAETGVEFGAETGSDALSKALENFGGAYDFDVQASVPGGRGNSSTTLVVTPIKQAVYTP